MATAKNKPVKREKGADMTPKQELIAAINRLLNLLDESRLRTVYIFILRLVK